MASNAAQQHSEISNFILAFNACQTPKEALRMIQEVWTSKVFSAVISTYPDTVQVCCSNLAGSTLAEYSFPLDSSIAELEANIIRKHSEEAISGTCLTFLDDEGSKVSGSCQLKDRTRLTVRACLSAADVGKLMYRSEDCVSVDLLGQCLGNHGEFWKELAVSYPENFVCFAGMDVVKAIRAYLWRFRLPGESAQIERIVEGFARSYFHHNTTWGKEKHQLADDVDEASREDNEANEHQDCWAEGVQGWYVRQPLSGPKLLPCCVHCGALEDSAGELVMCRGCGVVHFCHKCRRNASRYGHAVVGSLGYGRACVAAKSAAGSLGPAQIISYQRSMRHGVYESSVVSEESLNWVPVSPFRNEDAVMVLAYSVIMLTTNLHSAHVKDKMKKHEFIKQNREINGGDNFPGDFLAKVYDDIQQEELKVMRSVD